MVGLISTLIVIPLIGAFALCVGRPRNARAIALIFNALAAFLALTLWRNFDSGAAGLQMVEHHAWIPAIGAEYLVGVDGLSLLLVLLTSLIIPFAFLAQRMTRGFCAIMLAMQSALYGTFTAQNFLLWFLFYEMSLIPAFLLIKIWGGENRDRAATKFFLYTFLGSVAMLLSFLGIYFAKGTFDFATLAVLGKNGLLTGKLAWLAFGGIFIGLAVKVPVFPFHTWLPDAYETAPTGASMVLTGVLSKMGVYGFVRLLLPLFPSEIRILGPWMLGLAVCSIVFASLAAWAQSDLKRMVAYLSINHLGYCMLGLFAVTASPVVAATIDFIGEFLIFKGSFAMAASFTAIAVIGLLVTAIAFARAMQALFSGPLAKSCSAFPDLLRSEKLVVIPMTLLMFAIGIAPQFIFNIFNTTVVQMTRLFA